MVDGVEAAAELDLELLSGVGAELVWALCQERGRGRAGRKGALLLRRGVGELPSAGGRLCGAWRAKYALLRPETTSKTGVP